ncbi:MAG: SurA N-terminal domain-containing protein [Deltaproteobacteria bacterium]|nr:SurA N-terminal domain-containing protein [Deltaproteobacteria bacterium]MBW1951963.1 SurA N-terminal domain-containing protein [Deltaproteobacteria bacterium]MBW1986739.1 SurA N-terminal domain-containing protein [Deltaproteobacteria bacterium]MBW2134266.1 SurA N-terminal domain-containing protein [Deltaproteobacteria bacterium]
MKISSRFIILLVLFLALVGPAPAEIVDRIVAQVNGEIITLSDVEQSIKFMRSNPQTGGRIQDNEATRRQMLDVLIDRKLAKEEANRLGITIPDNEVAQALEAIKKKNNLPDDEALAQALAKEGMTLDQLRQQITEQMQQERLIQYTVKGKVRVSEDKIREYYDNVYRQGGSQVHLKLIVLPYPPGATETQKAETRALAEKILQECRQGASFESLARQYSKGPNAANGGDLGYVDRADIDPNIYALIERLCPGEYAPIESPQGFHLFKLVNRRAGRSKSFAEVKPEIERILLREQMAKKFSEWLKTLRDKAHIKILY